MCDGTSRGVVRAVDTNVLVRLVTRDDAKQVVKAEAFVAPGAWVPHLALVEAMCVLSSVYDRSPEAIATAVEMLLNHEAPDASGLGSRVGGCGHLPQTAGVGLFRLLGLGGCSESRSRASGHGRPRFQQTR